MSAPILDDPATNQPMPAPRRRRRRALTLLRSSKEITVTRQSRRLALACLALATAATLAGCQRGDTTVSADPNRPQPPPASTLAPATPRATPPQRDPAPSPPTAPVTPSPIREVHQGDRLFGVYWVSASLAQLSPVEQRLRALGHPASSGDLDCDQGARRWLGVADSVTSRVAVYFGTEQDARAFAEGVEVRPRPYGVAAAALYCLD
jgi:hypothetical protein